MRGVAAARVKGSQQVLRRRAATFVDRPFVTELAAVKADEVRPMYRVMDRQGQIVSGEAPQLSKETVVKMYTVRTAGLC
jgi:hypothetical protein